MTLEQILDHISAGWLLVGLTEYGELVVEDMNAAGLRLFGKERSSWIPGAELRSYAGLGAAEPWVREAIETRVPFHGLLQGTAKSTGTRHFQTQIFPSGTPRKAVIIIDDKTAFAQLSEANQSLEKKLGAIRYAFSHELRAPLTNIVGLADIGTQAGTADSSQWFGLINQSAKALLRTQDRLIQLLGIPALELRSEIVHPDVMIRDIVSSKNRKMFDLSLSGVSIRSSEECVFGMLSEVIENAYVYAEPRPGSVKITLGYHGAGEVLALVSNDGASLPDSLTPSNQSMFVRGNVRSGTGLGLPIAYAYAQRINATLHFARTQNEAGQTGTAVEMCMPTC